MFSTSAPPQPPPRPQRHHTDSADGRRHNHRRVLYVVAVVVATPPATAHCERLELKRRLRTTQPDGLMVTPQALVAYHRVLATSLAAACEKTGREAIEAAVMPLCVLGRRPDAPRTELMLRPKGQRRP